MTKRWLVGMVVVLAMLVGVGMAAAAAKAPPILPDYTKAPFYKLGDGACETVSHPEFGEMQCVMYATTEKPAPGEQAVWVGSDRDGALLYANWQLITEDLIVFRRYIFKSGAWVFENESSVKRPKN